VTPTPSVTPSTTPTPAYCENALLVNDLEDLQIAITRAGVPTGWSWSITRAESPDTDIYGSVDDNANAFSDLTDYPVQPVAVQFTSLSDPLSIMEGDYFTVTYDGAQMVNVYPPPISGLVDVYYFIGLDGATYADRWLCDRVEDVPTPTPTPTPSVTPSPSPTPSPTATPSAPPTATPSIAPTATPSIAPTSTPTPAPTATPACRCYVVPQESFESGEENLLILVNPYDFNPDTNETNIGTSTGTTGIETIAYHNESGLLYTVNYDRLGILDQVTGLFSPISADSIGAGYGAHGYKVFYDIDGMSFHPYTGILYVTFRDHGSNDLLIQVNLATGQHIPGAFNGDDYAVIEALIVDGKILDDVDDIAFDPSDGSLYAVENDSHYRDHLVILDPADGSLLVNVGQFYCVIAGEYIQDIEGLGFGCDGTLWGVTGNKTIIDQNDRLWEVDKTNAHLCSPRLLTHGTDYEAVTCGYFAPPQPTPSPVPVIIDSGDYDGDGTSDIAVFRGSSGMWAVRGVTRTFFGTLNDRPVSADYDGDGTSDISIFRDSNGLWAIRGVSRIYYGTLEDLPVPGDYDGDGLADVGIFRQGPGLWAVRWVTRIYFGGSGDLAVPGDYDGDGIRDIGIFRHTSGLWALRGISRVYFGGTWDITVPGEYDGNGTWQVSVFRPSSGLWAIRGWSRIYFGNSSDQPVPADYVGSSTDDIGIFRPSSGLWAIRGISRVYYGTTGDIPVTR
jgi:cell division septation protein DedD